MNAFLLQHLFSLHLESRMVSVSGEERPVRRSITSTLAHLDEAANGEDDEIEEMYPRFIREAEVDGRADAVASFRLALEREKHHRAMFKDAFGTFKQ